MTQDTDFLIYQYPEHIEYLSLKDFNFAALFKDHKTLETLAYSRQALADHLDSIAQRAGSTNLCKFEVGHLPLFASLKGNDVIHYDDLAKFHKELTKSSKYKLSRGEICVANLNAPLPMVPV